MRQAHEFIPKLPGSFCCEGITNQVHATRKNSQFETDAGAWASLRARHRAAGSSAETTNTCEVQSRASMRRTVTGCVRRILTTGAPFKARRAVPGSFRGRSDGEHGKNSASREGANSHLPKIPW